MLALTAPAQAQDITVYSSGSLAIGESRKLVAYVPLAVPTVNWAVNGVAGGNPLLGTVSSTGLYKAPSAIPTPNRVTVRATSTAQPAKSGAVVMTITQVPVRLWSSAPTSVPAGAFTLSLNGRYFSATDVARLGGVALATTRLSSTQLMVSGTALPAQVGTKLPLVVVQAGNGATISDTVMLAVTAGAPPPPPPTGVAVTVSPSSLSLAAGSAAAFQARVTGSSNSAVTWSVNGINGGNASLGTISVNGAYLAPAAPPSPATLTLRATSQALATAVGLASVTITAATNPGTGQGTVDLAAARLLEQAAFGPTPTALARVKQVGAAAWLDEQFGVPETTIAIPSDRQNYTVQAQFLSRLSSAPDQLRQRMAHALLQMLVVSINKNNYPEEIVPHLQLLSRHAFGNYRALLGEMAISPQMGKYLDAANSNKPGVGSGANENFPRELLQLFTIGLVQLNADGSVARDAAGMARPAFDQTTVQQLALALTGWTYVGAGNNNWENFAGPMVPRDVNHDLRAKAFLGCNLPAGQSTQQDMTAALDCIFNHPNVGPFVVTRLIRNLVTSNPTPAYVARVVAIFNNNGFGVRGDLRATLRALLLDAEARNDVAGPDSGRLKDPVFHIVSLARALGGSLSPTNQQAWSFSRMGETPLMPPSVFGFYSPMFRAPQLALFGPEFQIYTPTEAVLRGNFMWQILSNPGTDFPLDLTRFVNLGGNTAGLIDAVDQTLMYGRMPAAMRQTLATAVVAQGDNRSRALTALYLTLLSGQHAIQY